MTLVTRYWQSQLPSDTEGFAPFSPTKWIAWCTTQFTTANYYFMCPNKEFFEQQLLQILQEAKEGTLYHRIPIAKPIQEIIQRRA